MHFGFVEAVWFLWDYLWASGEAQDGVAMGVVCPLPSGLASDPLTILN